MSLAIKYENAEDARMRLRGTMVLYKGEPVLIMDVQPGEDKNDILRVLIQELPAKQPKGGNPFNEDAARKPFAVLAAEAAAEAKLRKYISSKHFDIAPFPLGYVNHPDCAFYASRLPNRVQKQGLCAENFIGVLPNGAGIAYQTFTACKETVAMIKGDYPSIDRAYALLDKSLSVAFDRDYALVRDLDLDKLVYIYHKGVKVGLYSKGEIMLGKKFNCLKERLTEMRLKIAA